jgi:predicted dehydrogenase
MNKIRIGVIGLGGICRDRHLPGFRRVDGVEVVSVVNRTLESSRAAADGFGIAGVDESWEALVGRDDLDAVVVGTWPYMHRDISCAALRAGKHVFCQARMAMNLVEAEDMSEVWRASGKVGMLCPVPFGLSIDRTMVKLLGAGALGDVRLVTVQSFTDMFASPEAPVNWRKDHNLSGLNMHTLGMYIEMVQRWFGPTKSVSARSDIFNVARLDPDGNKFLVEIPDQIQAMTTSVSGVPIQYTMNSAVPNGVDRVMIYGSEKTLRYDVFADRLSWIDGREDLTVVDIAPEDEYDVKQWRVEEDFVRAIREPGFEYYPSFEDGVEYMKVVQGIHDSIEGGMVTGIQAK